jgi:hypothetical protein
MPSTPHEQGACSLGLMPRVIAGGRLGTRGTLGAAGSTDSAGRREATVSHAGDGTKAAPTDATGPAPGHSRDTKPRKTTTIDPQSPPMR